jgi:hypothetical protein
MDLVSEGILFVILGSLMYATKRNQSSYFSSFWVEAIPVAWYLMLLVVRLF